MTLHPIMTIMILIALTIVISGIFTLFGVQVTYNKVNVNTLKYSTEVISANNLFSSSGIKYIFSTTVSNFVQNAYPSKVIFGRNMDSGDAGCYNCKIDLSETYFKCDGNLISSWNK